MNVGPLLLVRSDDTSRVAGSRGVAGVGSATLTCVSPRTRVVVQRLLLSARRCHHRGVSSAAAGSGCQREDSPKVISGRPSRRVVGGAGLRGLLCCVGLVSARAGSRRRPHGSAAPRAAGRGRWRRAQTTAGGDVLPRCGAGGEGRTMSRHRWGVGPRGGSRAVPRRPRCGRGEIARRRAWISAGETRAPSTPSSLVPERGAQRASSVVVDQHVEAAENALSMFVLRVVVTRRAFDSSRACRGRHLHFASRSARV